MRHTFVLGAVVLASPLQSAAAETAPPPAAAGQKEGETQTGWLSRMANSPKKLAFWNKEGKVAEPPPVPAASPSATKPSRRAPAAADTPKIAKAQKAGKKEAAPAHKKTAPEPEPAPSEAEKKSGFLPRIPIPFLKKEVAEPPAEVPPPPAPPEKKQPAKKSASSPETPPAPLPPDEADKPGFLSRIWGGGREPEVAEAGHAPPSQKEKLGPAKPGAEPAKKSLAAAPSAVAPETGASDENTEKKPSFWARMTSSVTSVMPSLPERPKTTPIVRGALPGGAADLSSSTFVITKDDSPFYSFGPNQATPPDAYLATGTIVTLTEKSWGWAEVRLADGRSGIVARDSLRLATAFDIVPETAPATSLMASVEPPKLKKTPMPSFVLPDMDLPELPEPDPELTGPLPPGETPADAEALSASLLPPFEE